MDKDFLNEISELQTTVQELLKGEQGLFSIVKNLQITLSSYKNALSNMKYEMLDPRLASESIFFPDIADYDTTLDEIINNRKSIARFGDGEFSIILGTTRHKFQSFDEELSNRLYEILNSNNENLLIGLADNYGSLNAYSDEATVSIRLYMTEQVRDLHYHIINPNKLYYNAYITRPYTLYKNKDLAKSRFNRLKQIWDNRDVIIIEGAQTRFGFGNDLLANAKTVRRIIGPATNTYSRYNDLLNAAFDITDKETLFLIATGPSAGLFAYDLTIQGYQAVDIGHTDIEYECFLAGLENGGAIKGKYCNEYAGGDNVDDSILSPVYFNQIIASYM